MSEQPLDLRRSAQVIRRYRILVFMVAALGLLIGVALAWHSRPALTSTAQVVLPGADSTQTATQVVVAESNPVLSGALPNISPAISLAALAKEIQVTAQTSNILAISATGTTAAQAQTTANAVANSYIAYVTSPRSKIGQEQASMLSAAARATGTTHAKEIGVYALIGAVIGVLIGVTAALVLSRRDRLLRGRDEIANAVGAPVLASFPVSHPTDPAGWTKLLSDYEPGPVPALRLRQALQQLGLIRTDPNNGGEAVGSSLAVVSLSSDPRAVAVGPQLAAFAASLGIPTALVVGPQQDASATATLRVACSAPLSPSLHRASQLRVAVVDDANPNGLRDAVLTVVVGVVDSRDPRVAHTMRAAATVLGVSAGVATAEQLALATASAAADGREIAGILVADPDPADRSSGRIPRLANRQPLAHPAQSR